MGGWLKADRDNVLIYPIPTLLPCVACFQWSTWSFYLIWLSYHNLWSYDGLALLLSLATLFQVLFILPAMPDFVVENIKLLPWGLPCTIRISRHGALLLRMTRARRITKCHTFFWSHDPYFPYSSRFREWFAFWNAGLQNNVVSQISSTFGVSEGDRRSVVG